MMTKEDILHIDVGDTLIWTPELESKDLEGFKRSNQYFIFEDKGVEKLEIQIVDNRHGFENLFSWEMRGIMSDGSYLTDFIYLHDEEQQKDIIENDNEFYEEYKCKVWVETDEDTSFLNYLLSNGAKYFDLI